MLLVAGSGILIASLARVLGFSVAVGAFFAGLAFSRDPHAVKLQGSFNTLHAFFAPFFFIGIGLRVDPGVLGSSVGLVAVLIVIAVAMKLIGGGIPSLAMMGRGDAALLGTSLVPRAEISLIVMQHGLTLGPGAVPQRLYAALVMVSIVSCVLPPPFLERWLKRIPRGEGVRS
jgi:Kef-type K+ transport system membrane component KefB